MLLDGRGEMMDDLTAKGSICLMCDEFSTDGVIVVNDSKKGDFRMDAFDSDGNHIQRGMAGVRCAVSFASSLGIKASSDEGWYAVETTSGIVQALITATDGPQDNICIKMPDLGLIEYIENLSEAPVDGWVVELNGQRHFVVLDEDIDDINVEGAGKVISACKEFAPKGAEVDFVSHYQGRMKARTYDFIKTREKTCSCEGSVASVLAAFKAGICPQAGGDVHVECELWTKGYQAIISFIQGETITDIRYSGGASFVMCTY